MGIVERKECYRARKGGESVSVSVTTSDSVACASLVVYVRGICAAFFCKSLLSRKRERRRLFVPLFLDFFSPIFVCWPLNLSRVLSLI